MHKKTKNAAHCASSTSRFDWGKVSKCFQWLRWGEEESKYQWMLLLTHNERIAQINSQRSWNHNKRVPICGLGLARIPGHVRLAFYSKSWCAQVFPHAWVLLQFKTSIRVFALWRFKTLRVWAHGHLSSDAAACVRGSQGCAYTHFDTIGRTAHRWQEE